MSEENALVVRQYDGLTMAIAPQVALQRLQELQDFVARVMVPDTDYGTIPGTPKPTLFQPGAQKLCEIYGLAPHYEMRRCHEDWDKDTFAYDVTCSLISRRDGSTVATGIGHCNSRERKYAKRSGADQVNTLQKMAAKRALVHAVLGATRSAGIFTQDLDDEASEPKNEASEPKNEPAKPEISDEDKQKTHHELRMLLTSAKGPADLDGCKTFMAKAWNAGRLTQAHMDDLVAYGKECREKFSKAKGENANAGA